MSMVQVDIDDREMKRLCEYSQKLGVSGSGIMRQAFRIYDLYMQSEPAKQQAAMALLDPLHECGLVLQEPQPPMKPCVRGSGWCEIDCCKHLFGTKKIGG